MFFSADFVLLNLFTILIPSFIVLLATLSYSYIIIIRYNKVLKRLYRSSFRGVDFERKRIASELHDHLAVHSISFSEDISFLKSKLTGNELIALQNLESKFEIFRYKTHQIVEYMYPKVLSDLDWESSLQQLSNELTMGKIRVIFESYANKSPKNDWLFHTYWAIKEIVTNAIKHGNVKNVQITATDEDSQFIISIHYRATEEAKRWIESKSKPKNGLGTIIIQDRLNIVGAKMINEIIDGVVTQSIILKNENSDF